MNSRRLDALALTAVTIAASSFVVTPARADGPPPASEVNLTPPAPPPAPAPPPPSDATPVAGSGVTGPVEVLPGPHPARLASYILGGAAVVSAGVGATFGVLALHDKNSYDARPTSALVASGNQDAVVADVALGAAVIAGVTSVILFLKEDPAPAKPTTGPAVAIAPFMVLRGAGAGATVRF
jgi:hypothetical protein